MSQTKSVPLGTVPSSSSHDPTAPYPQPSHAVSDRQEEVIVQPWWAESDYIPPYIQEFVEANAGLSLVCAAQLFFALMNVTVKYFISSTDISIPSLILVRQGITAAGCIFTLRYIGEPYPFLGPPDVRNLLLARGLFGFGALVSTYESFQGLSVTDTTTIQFLSPSVLVVMGYFFLREKPTVREIIAGFLCLIGVTLVSRPSFIFGNIDDEVVGRPPGRVDLPPEHDADGDEKSISRAAGVAWAFASVFGGSAAYLIIRAIGKRAHALHSMAYFANICCIATLPVVLFVPGQGHMPNTFKGFFLIILIGLFGFIAQTLLTMGLQRERAGRASLAIYTSVFFAIVLELVIFHTFPSFLSLIGVSIILTSAAWVAIQGAKAIQAARQGDIESEPISRAPSPLPSPDLTRRGEHYSYTSIPTTEEPSSYGYTASAGQAGGAGGAGAPMPKDGLQVPARGPALGRRRSSGNSETAALGQ